ncbi:DNA-directed primase/polymerase protein isoform X5 [Lynx canadensis]|uniref:DNA-directed primase/polymerase protein isoform X5 n=1 Tax=Lynx canadensis TaxID=61383 RepID=UPI0011B0B262|nr:DNA-directed primase/polymerase protein isoform X5 [Lynx canadensis]
MERKWEAKLKQIEERAACYERKPLSSVYRPRLSKPEEPPSIWKLFHRQTEAFNFVKSCKEDVHVFALEYKVGDGQRIYLVTTYTQLWFYYKSRKNLLHCYEVIPENAVCKLYFDLEFNKHANPEADGKKMVALLIEHVCKALQELYRVNCSAEDVFNLDSSTEEKFSRHLIFQLHDVAFKDNIHVGNFVRKILQPAFHLIASEDDSISEKTGHGFSHFSETPIKQGISFGKMSPDQDGGESWTLNSEELERPGSAKQSSPDLSFLVVRNNTGEKQLFVDLGVYTRNRNFRLYKSSKIGKHVALEIAEDNKFFPKHSETVSEENQCFLSSLVSNVRILVDLKNEVWYQKCHDPVCKAENFKSDCFPLPAEVGLLFLLKEEEEFTATETMNSETENPHKPPSSMLSKGVASDADWDNGIDDTYFLEATEDAELAEAAENGLLSYYSGVDEIPDELILQVLQE